MCVNTQIIHIYQVRLKYKRRLFFENRAKRTVSLKRAELPITITQIVTCEDIIVMPIGPRTSSLPQVDASFTFSVRHQSMNVA